MLTSGRRSGCRRRSMSDAVRGTVDGRRTGGLAGRWRAARRWLAVVAVLAHTSAVVERQESVCVAVAAAVRELAAGARRHVVEEALLDRPARTGLRRQRTDLCTSSSRLNSSTGINTIVKLLLRRKLD